MVEYVPTLNEILVCLGIWSFGLLLYTVFVRMSVPVLSGEITYLKRYGYQAGDRPGPSAVPAELRS